MDFSGIFTGNLKLLVQELYSQKSTNLNNILEDFSVNAFHCYNFSVAFHNSF